MKLAIKSAGLCGTGAFILGTLPGMFQYAEPLNILSFSLPAALAMAMLGYIIGDILSKPKGRHQTRSRPPSFAGKPNKAAGQPPVTGEESFLDDEGSVKQALPIEPSKIDEE